MFGIYTYLSLRWIPFAGPLRIVCGLKSLTLSSAERAMHPSLLTHIVIYLYNIVYDLGVLLEIDIGTVGSLLKCAVSCRRGR